MVWGGISLEARMNIVILSNDSVTADRHIGDILQPEVIPCATYNRS